MTEAKTAMVLAAGFGERMRPLTLRVPKPLVPLAGRPLIDHVLDRLVQAGVKTAVVNVHYLPDQLVEHGFDPHQAARGNRLRPRQAHQPAHRRHQVTEHPLQRNSLLPDIGQQSEHRVGEIDQRHQHDQHCDDVEQEFEACHRALDDRVHGGGGVHVGIDEPASGALLAGLGHHDQADQDRGGCAQHRGNDKMRGGVGDQRRQQRGVKHQHGAGDSRHAAGHHKEQLAPCQLRQIRPDEQRRFHHAEKDIGGGGQPDRAADPERALQ